MSEIETIESIHKKIMEHFSDSLEYGICKQKAKPSRQEMITQHYTHGTPHPDDEYLPIYCWED